MRFVPYKTFITADEKMMPIPNINLKTLLFLVGLSSLSLPKNTTTFRVMHATRSSNQIGNTFGFFLPNDEM